MKILALKRGAKILDLACGHGRHAIELARRGYQVTGQDLNRFFLEKAKRDAKRAKVTVRWVQGDMREIPFEGEFDVVLNLFTAFGYLENDEQDKKVLHQIAKALKRGGKFVLDIINRDHIIRIYREKDWQLLPDGSMVLIERKFDHATGRNLERRIRVWKDGRRDEFTLSLRMYTMAELAAMLKRAGLKLKEVYGNVNAEPLSFDSQRSILVAMKQ